MSNFTLEKLAILASHSSLLAKAQALAHQLCVPVICKPSPEFDFLLRFTSTGLELCLVQQTDYSPLKINFTSGAVAHRRRFGGGRGQPIARAMGLKTNPRPTVLDVTAGLGRDSYLLACLGCQVTMVERSPILYALLLDGLERLQAVADLWDGLQLELIQADAITLLPQLKNTEKPDVIYLDPMYPHRSKSSLVKKEMRILRALVGDDEDAEQLLATALQCARKRVVVKRPKSAECVGNIDVAMSIESKNTRFDVYLV